MNMETYGVYFDMNRKKWIAQLTYEGRNIYIGEFIDKDVAHASSRSSSETSKYSIK